MRFLNLFLVFIAIACSGYMGWRFTQPELNGHWHIIQDDSKINPGISTLDISRNNVVQADKLKVGGSSIGGPLDRFRRHIHLFPTCLSLELNISWNGDTLILTDARPFQEGSGVLKAVLVPKRECTAEEDHFLPSKYQVSLPTVAVDEATLPYQAQSLNFILTPEQKGMPGRIINYYGKELSLGELILDAEMMDIKNSSKAPATIISIFANAGVSSARIEEIKKVFSRESKGRRIYRVKKKFDEDDRLHFLWVEI